MRLGKTNRRTARYRAMLELLPRAIRSRADEAFDVFCEDPSHPSLRLHELEDNRRGSHHPGSISATINMQYRAICFVDGDCNVWYWVGTHGQYDTFTGD